MLDKAEAAEFEWLAPDRFMQPEERRRIRQLLRQQKSLTDKQWRPTGDIRLSSAQREKLSTKCRASHTKLEELSADMLNRYLGVGRYSVLRVRHPDREETLLQLLRVDVGFNDWNRRWLWCVHGRKLRKNGTLGFADAFTCFDFADVRRRRLDGIWERVLPLDLADEPI
jgi:hypothetical protein